MELNREMIELGNKNSLYKAMGIRIESLEEGMVKSRLEPKSEMCWPFPNQPHGGVLFTLMDTTMAWAVISNQEKAGSCTTINLDIQYTQPAKATFFSCVAEVISQTRQVSFVKAVIHDPYGVVVSVGQGTYRIMQNRQLKPVLIAASNISRAGLDM
ncbi:MAG: PaaI family thioesterase [Smithellaceae bacterium]|jgi:uncharacterized protein (TIGR00369 family)|nr:PaaI family thioesterase [Smithellaceae bacterium]